MDEAKFIDIELPKPSAEIMEYIDRQIVELNDELLTLLAKLPHTAREFVVSSNADYEEACDWGRTLRKIGKHIEERMKPQIDAAYYTHKALTTRREEFLRPINDAVAEVKRKIENYSAEIRRQQEEEERKLRAEALRIEQERALKHAIELEQMGMAEEAERVIDSPVVAPLVVAVAPKLQADGVSQRQDWTWRLVNLDLVPRQWLVLNKQGLSQFVRATKGTVPVSGIEIVPKTITRFS